MGYHLNALIGNAPVLAAIQQRYPTAVIVTLEHELCMIPMTGTLYDEINQLQLSADLEPFAYLNERMEQSILALIGDQSVAYFEADYFGGSGGQSAVVWQQGARASLFTSENSINAALKLLGVTAARGKRDAFDTMGLGRHRDVDDWLE